MTGISKYQVWADGGLIGWASAVVLGQPSVGPGDLASPEVLIPIRWKTEGRGGVGARGYCRMLYGFAPKRGREALAPPPEYLARAMYATVRDDMGKHGWTEVTPGADPAGLPRHSGFLTFDLGCWAINVRRLA
jgi:hypothetical protein